MQTRLFPAAAAFAALTLLAACGGGDAPRAGDTPGDSAAAGSDSAAAGAQATPGGSSANVMAKAPAQIRGIYLNAYALGPRLKGLIKLADDTEINAFVIDWKDERGPHYNSEHPLAKELTGEGEVTIRNPKALTDSLRAHGIYSIARIVVFKDPVLSKRMPDWSTRKAGGGLWVDKAGNTWVSPWDERVWDYNIALAEEAAKAGFDMIQFDYVRFAEPYRSLPPQVHPAAKGERTDAIAAFLNRAKQRLHPLGVPVTADVFGLTPNTPDDLDIGQQWETINATADAVLPMVYPSHYFPTHLKGITRPNRMPYETVYQSVGMGVVRNQRLGEAGVQPARIIPWLQAFSAPWVDRNYTYGPEQAAAQIRAVHDLGLEDWVFWHPGSKYEQIASAFARETQPKAKTYAPPAIVTSTVATMERQGVLEARRRAADQARGRTTDPAAATAARQGRPEPDPAPAAAEPGTTAPAEATPAAPKP
jgi:hypothetical protein